MKRQILLFTTLAVSSLMLITSCNESSTSTKESGSTTETTTTTSSNTTTASEATGNTATTAPKDVVDVAMASADHTTLVAAVKAAGLVETLKGAGPFTIFAPTNAAFDKLPKGTVEGLLKPEKKADLAGILTYHVVPGNIKAADLKDGQKVKTVNGKELTVGVKDGKVTINGAAVTTADVAGSNGVIHIIDGVVLPK